MLWFEIAKSSFSTRYVFPATNRVQADNQATASVDFETDALIQKSIRDLPSHCTVLTVAHRLATVMDYDKILVLGAGKLLEYDSPDKLRNNKDSYFAKLVQAMEGPSR